MIRRAPLILIGLFAATCGGNGGPGPGPTPIAGAPEITCPADISMRGVLGPTQPVTFTAPAVTGGELPNTVTCSRTSGAAFALGTTPVTCSVSDARGRQASCAFNVALTALSVAVTKYETVGDSFTEGENGRFSFLDIPNAYPTRLQAAFDAAFPGQGVIVINRGHSGDPIEKTVLELPDHLARDRPGAVLVLSGYNNLLGGCGRGPANTASCQRAITAVSFGIRDCIREATEAPFSIPYVFVSTLTPSGPVLPGAVRDRGISNDAIVQANARIRQQVAAERVTLVDVHPLFIGREAEYIDLDGLHLRPAGNQALADAFFAAIRATVPQTPLFSAR